MTGQTNNNQFVGLLIHSGRTGNQVYFNRSFGNRGFDMFDDNPPGLPCANVWRFNSFGTKGGDAVDCIR